MFTIDRGCHVIYFYFEIKKKDMNLSEVEFWYKQRKTEFFNNVFRELSFSKEKFIYLIYSHFWKDKLMSAKAAALTFYTLTSIVPAFSLFMAIIKGFNIQDDLKNLVVHIIPAVTEDGVDDFMLITEQYINNTSFILINVFLALWGCYKLKNCVEAFCNNMWQTEDKIELLGQLKDLFVDIVFIVFSFLVLCPIIHYVKNDLAIYSIGFLFVFLMLFLGNLYIPHKVVEKKNALLGAFISFALIVVFNIGFKLLWDYMICSYTSTYGLFASLFIILVWLNFIWLFFLVGVSSACIMQKHYTLYLQDQSKHISTLYKLYLTVLTAAYFMQRKEQDPVNGKYYVNADNYTNHMKIPFVLSEQIIKELTELNLIRWESGTGSWEVYQKDNCKPIVTVGDLIEELLKRGCYDMKYDYTAIQQGAVWHSITNNILYATTSMNNIKLSEIDLDVRVYGKKEKEPCTIESISKNFSSFLKEKEDHWEEERKQIEEMKLQLKNQLEQLENKEATEKEESFVNMMMRAYKGLFGK